jgi:hypothetical protein
MGPNDNNQNTIYAATMAAYAKSASSLLARLDGCSHQASASSSAVKSVNREPTEKNITRKEM